MKIRTELINEGLSKVKNMGFQHVTTENILYDEVYSEYFLAMLLLKLGSDKNLNEAVCALINEIKNNTKAKF